MSYRVFLVLFAVACTFAMTPQAQAQYQNAFSPFLSDNEGGGCIRGTGAYGTAQIMNRCTEAVSIAYCNSANCRNYDYVATIAPQGYFNFSGRSVSMKACKPGLIPVIGKTKELAMCVPTKVTQLRHVGGNGCLNENIRPNRQFEIANHCSQSFWIAYCVGPRGQCAKFDKVILVEGYKTVPISTGPNLARLAICAQGGKPDISRKPPSDKPVQCR